MKHLLLIILSFLLLSSPVIGHPKGEHTLYKWKNHSGDGFVWKGFGDKETHPVYKGEVENGEPNGLGIMFYPKGRNPKGIKYVGSWKNGEKSGYGIETYFNGSKNVGIWKNGEIWNGEGYDKNGDKVSNYVNGMYKVFKPHF